MLNIAEFEANLAGKEHDPIETAAGEVSSISVLHKPCTCLVQCACWLCRAVTAYALLQGRVASADVSGLLQHQDRGADLGEAPANTDGEAMLQYQRRLRLPRCVLNLYLLWKMGLERLQPTLIVTIRLKLLKLLPLRVLTAIQLLAPGRKDAALVLWGTCLHGSCDRVPGHCRWGQQGASGNAQGQACWGRDADSSTQGQEASAAKHW